MSSANRAALQRRRRGSALRATTALALGLGAIATSTAIALAMPHGTMQSSPASHDVALGQRAGLDIRLIEQSFTLDADASFQLVYQLSGDLDAAADIAPTTTTTTTTSTTTTTTTTTTAISTTTTGGEAPPTTDAPPPPTVPEPRAFTVDIANFAAITDINDANLLLGASAVPGAFRRNIDGVRVTDARSLVEIIDTRTATLTITIPTDTGGSEGSGPDSLEFPTSGIYPIRVQLLIDDNLVGTHGTLVERRPGPDEINRPSAPVNFAIITAAALTDSQSPFTGDAGPAPEALDRVEEIITAAAEIDAPILASIPPIVLTAALDRAGNTVQQNRSLLVDDELVALSDVQLDVSSAVAAGLDEQYTEALRRGEDALTTALSRPPTRVVRVIDAPISALAAQLLRTVGVRLFAMTPQRYDDLVGGVRPDTDRFVDVALPDGGTLPLLLTDPISERFTTTAADDALATSTTTEWALRTVAEVVLDHRSQGRVVRRSRLIGLDDLGPPDPRLVNAFTDMAATTPDVDLVSATELVGITDTQRAPDGDAILLPDVAGPDLTARLTAIDATRVSVSSTASMLSASDQRLPNWVDRLDALLSNGVTDSDAVVVMADIADEEADIRGAIKLPDPFTFTLTGRADRIPVRLRNTGNEQLRVVLSLSSPTLTFPGNDRLVTLRPNDSTDIQVPVRARSNGTSPVSVQLLTPLGEALGEPVVLTARVNSLTGLGQVLTAGFLLMLASWWIANWRKKRSTDLPTEEGQARPGRASAPNDCQ